jgi:hypothetical protein
VGATVAQKKSPKARRAPRKCSGSEKIKPGVASNFVWISPGIVLYLVSSAFERTIFPKMRFKDRNDIGNRSQKGRLVTQQTELFVRSTNFGFFTDDESVFRFSIRRKISWPASTVRQKSAWADR